jgi:DNA-3-methyladenine glycosylase
MSPELLAVLQSGSEVAAPALLGTHLIHEAAEGRVVGRIVETEAYHQSDPASHTFRGPTKRNASMFLAAGHLYVYFTYGMHLCANIVCGKEEVGEGVLIRAIEPVEGLGLMEQWRGTTNLKAIGSGPARSAQALGITGIHDGISLSADPLRLEGTPYHGVVESGPRIGISRGTDTAWRFWLPNCPFVSRQSFLRERYLLG